MRGLAATLGAGSEIGDAGRYDIPLSGGDRRPRAPWRLDPETIETLRVQIEGYCHDVDSQLAISTLNSWSKKFSKCGRAIAIYNPNPDDPKLAVPIQPYLLLEILSSMNSFQIRSRSPQSSLTSSCRA